MSLSFFPTFVSYFPTFLEKMQLQTNRVLLPASEEYQSMTMNASLYITLISQDPLVTNDKNPNLNWLERVLWLP